MERLTKRIGEYVYYTQGKYPDTTVAEMIKDDIRNALQKLADYEDAEEQGLLLRLPCKVGDAVYLTEHNRLVFRDRPLICIVDEFSISGISGTDCCAILNANEPFYALHRFKAVNIKDFGKTVFLTKEAAEQKLAEMKGEHENV